MEAEAWRRLFRAEISATPFGVEFGPSEQPVRHPGNPVHGQPFKLGSVIPARLVRPPPHPPQNSFAKRLRHHRVPLGDMKRLLFLDFDGVLHPAVTKPGQCLPFEWLPELTALLSEAPDVGIAIHSSWAERYSLDELSDFLGPLGCRLIGAVNPGPKASSILLFLRSKPDAVDWLVIDDEADQFLKDFPGTVVICDRDSGISDPAVQAQIRRWLATAVKSLRASTHRAGRSPSI